MKEKIMKEKILVCSFCGSSDVETQAWVKVNEDNKYSGDVDPLDSDCNWCNGCSRHTSFKQKYKKNEKNKRTTSNV